MVEAKVHWLHLGNDDSAAVAERALSLFHRGRSLLVHPRDQYPDLATTVAQVRRLTARDLVVTDLDRRLDVIEGAGARGAHQIYAFHTSGSTGWPKCIVYDAATACQHAEAIGDRLELFTSDHLHVAMPPPNFAYGLSVAHSHTHTGGTLGFCRPTLGAPEVATLMDVAGSALRRHRDNSPVTLYLLPQHVPLLATAEWPQSQCDRVQRVISAGGPMSRPALEALERKFPNLLEYVNMYGQAQLGPRISSWHGQPSHFSEGRVGTPLCGVNVEARAGQLYVSSPYAMIGQIGHPYQTFMPREHLVFHATGDRGEVTREGISVFGRLDDVVTVAGTQVDLGQLHAYLQGMFQPVGLRVSNQTRHRGTRPLVELVSPEDAKVTSRQVRSAMHAEIGSLAALFEVRVTSALTANESGK